ncbi:MAG: hypothetical protein MJY44_00680 [Bacteroidales bacterium]|nr:hypothetical protein [Bacteroidales bacterium]
MKRVVSILSLLLFGCLFLGAQNLPEGVVMPDAPGTAPYVDYRSKVSGFWAGVDVGSGVSLNVDPAYKASVTADVHAVAGYRFNSFIMVGVGAGVKVYALPGSRVDAKYPGNIVSIPVFLNARGVMMNPRSRVVLPCWSMDAGYSFFDGVYVSPMLGIRVGSAERHHFVAGLAYVLQGAEVHTTVDGSAPGYVHSLQLKLGYQF